MSSEKIIHADGATLTREIAENDTVLVDFWAPWCAPCKAMAPLLDRIAGEYPNIRVVKVDAEAHEPLMADYDVQSLPTIQIYRGGKCVEQLRGKLPYPVIQRALQAAL
jgi:thioredoxin